MAHHVAENNSISRTPCTLGIEIENGKYYGILRKNTKIPVIRKKFFTTVSTNQNSIEVHVLRGEKRNISGNISLGRFILSGLKPFKNGEIKIEITFKLDHDAKLSVKAMDKCSGIFHQIVIYNSISVDSNDSSGKILLMIEKIENIIDKHKDKIENKFYNEIIYNMSNAREKLMAANKEPLDHIKVELETILCELNVIIDNRNS